jgi:hypothetical protein
VNSSILQIYVSFISILITFVEDEKIIILFYNDRNKPAAPRDSLSPHRKEFAEPMTTTALDTKEKLIKIIKSLLHTDEDLDFLLRLDKEDLEKLASVVRARTYITEK